MKEVEVKKMQSTTRRTKIVIFGLLCIIIFLAYNVYTLHRDNKELVRRKKFLVLRLRSCKEETDKLNEGVGAKTRTIEGQQRLLKEQTDQISQSDNEIRKLETANNKHREVIGKLKESALSSQEALKSLQKVHKDVTEKLATLKSNFDKALIVCNTSAQETDLLKNQYIEKETALQNCLNERKDQQYKLEEARNTLNKRREAAEIPKNNVQPYNTEQNSDLISNLVDTNNNVAPLKTTRQLVPNQVYTTVQVPDKGLKSDVNQSSTKQPDSINDSDTNWVVSSPARPTNISDRLEVEAQSTSVTANETSIERPLNRDFIKKGLVPTKSGFKFDEKVEDDDDIEDI